MADLLDDLYTLNDYEDQAANQALYQHLPADTEFVWTGRPILGLTWEKGTLIRVFVGLIFTVGGGFATLLLTVTGKGWMALLFGAVFVGVGLFLSVGAFFWDRQARRHCYYGLTPKGLYVVQGGRLVFHPLKEVQQAAVYDRRSNGTGIVAHREKRGNTTYIKTYMRRIPYADAVFQLIQELPNH